MTVREAFLSRVRELCDLKNVTLYELAARSGLPKSTLLSALDADRGNPSLRTIARIADGFDMTLQEFFDSALFCRVLEER